MSFGYELATWLSLATIAALALAYAFDFARRRRALELIGSPAQLRRMMASLSSWRRVTKAVLIVLGVSLVVGAIAEPQVAGTSETKERGIDVAVVMDFSKSMLAADVLPSRVQRMKEEVEDLLDELVSDRVAVVTFAGAAAHFPLTDDHEAARSVFRGLAPADMPPGSDLGGALTVARCIVRPDRLEEPGCQRVGGRGRGGAPLYDEEAQEPAKKKTEVEDRARAIVIFTDGDDTGDEAMAQVKAAVELGIYVFLVGVGTPGGELIPELDGAGERIGWKKNDRGEFVTSRLDVAKLTALAAAAGGEGHLFTVAAKGFDITDVVAQLRHLKRGALNKRVVQDRKPIFQWLLFPAFMLLLIEACIGERKRRVIYPEEHRNAKRTT